MSLELSQPSEELTLERMRADIAAILQEEPSAILDDDNLIDLGLDSIRAMTLLQRWSELGMNVDFAEFAVRPELGNWWGLVEKSQSL